MNVNLNSSGVALFIRRIIHYTYYIYVVMIEKEGRKWVEESNVYLLSTIFVHFRYVGKGFMHSRKRTEIAVMCI